MNIWIEAYTVLLECIFTFYFFHRMLQPAYPSRWLIASIYILYYCLFVYTSLHFPMLPRLGVSSLFLLMSYHFLLKQSALKILYNIVIFYIIAAFADLFSGAVLTRMGIPVQECLGIGAGRFIYNTTAKILHLLLLILFLTVTQRRCDPHALRRAIPLIFCNAASSTVLLAQFESFIVSEQYAPFIISTVAVLLINIIICVYTESEKRFYEIQEQKRLMEQQLEYQQEYYQATIARQEESRVLWHDMKKHMLAMEALVADNRSLEAADHLTSLKKSLQHLEQTVHTGNQMLDGILNYGMQKANAAHVRLNLDLWVDPTLQFPVADFYVILGNTIDNAVEACSTLSMPDLAIINLILHQKNHTLFYEISNPMPPSPAKKAGKIHGYGLESVKECVQRNQGLFSLNTEDGVFCITITLNI